MLLLKKHNVNMFIYFKTKYIFMIDWYTITVSLFLICFMIWCAYFDIKYRCVPIKFFNWTMIILYLLIIVLYCIIGWFVIPIITALVLPFLLWFFSKGKYGAIDARLMMIVLLVIPSLVWQIFYLGVLVVITLSMWVITNYITKSYTEITSDGEMKCIPQVVSILISFVICFTIYNFGWFF